MKPNEGTVEGNWRGGEQFLSGKSKDPKRQPELSCESDPAISKRNNFSGRGIDASAELDLHNMPETVPKLLAFEGEVWTKDDHLDRHYFRLGINRKETPRLLSENKQMKQKLQDIQKL